MKDQNILLIGGTGRSGTTILYKIFSQHPDIASVPESRFLIDPEGLIDFYFSVTKLWSPYLYDIKLKRLKHVLDKSAKKSNLYFLNKIFKKFINYKIDPKYSNFSIIDYCPNYNSLYLN